MRTKKDLALFESNLRMPFLYFNFVEKAFPKSYAKVPYELHKLVNKIHNILWGNMEQSRSNLHYRYFGIPPQYVEHTEITAKKEVKDTLNSICKNIDKFMESGVVLLIHSPFESSAIAAGAAICKAYAPGENRKWLMVSYPEYCEGMKDFSGGYKYKLDKADSVDLLCLYMVGKEYTTDFTLAGLKSLLMTRKVDKKVTIITTHLTAAEFADRYGKEICVVELQCEDEKEINNFKALRRMVEG